MREIKFSSASEHKGYVVENVSNIARYFKLVERQRMLSVLVYRLFMKFAVSFCEDT
jgi:hypothetical protein